MATTTNYGWTTPDDTALVKDGASAIRSLGSAIDTTVFNNAGAAIAKTIVDAKGDIIAATAADTVSRLAVGANDTVLTADSSTATGLKWAAPSGGDFIKITSSSFSASSAVSVDNCFTSTYANYRIIFNVTSASVDAVINFRFRASGSDNTTSNYNAYIRYNGATAGNFATSAGNTFYIADGYTTGESFVIDILNPQVAQNSIFHLLGNLNINYGLVGSGAFTTTTQFDGIKFYPASGNITGTIAIYGYGA